MAKINYFVVWEFQTLSCQALFTREYSNAGTSINYVILCGRGSDERSSRVTRGANSSYVVFRAVAEGRGGAKTRVKKKTNAHQNKVVNSASEN